MPAGHGIRARTRDSFSKGFRKKGTLALSNYLRTFKIGDYVDIKVDPAVQKGMPFKVYHGRTGIIWNVTKRAVGVELNKEVNTRIMKKRIHVRVEHVRPSRCREEFLSRRAVNDEKKKEAKAKGEKAVTKRAPAVPREAFTLENVSMETVTAIPYDIVKEGIKM
ncbi:60S ribosomal protein L21A [Cymbomonas tetramitiformis]|uniref:60S ribosomal protein L21A n=1 Tax=Cymbomonas tetramitiformis TaxID=36881 RepID=A0AAE0LJR7_9CHLO|nr:60S ribosomal protein L21A [Cymbomonas tetramitiformis]|eukprot:gene18661-22280_t